MTFDKVVWAAGATLMIRDLTVTALEMNCTSSGPGGTVTGGEPLPRRGGRRATRPGEDGPG